MHKTTSITITLILAFLFIGCSSQSQYQDMSKKLTPKYQSAFAKYNIAELSSSADNSSNSFSGSSSTIYIYDKFLFPQLNFLDTCKINNSVLDFYIFGFNTNEDLYITNLSKAQIVRYGRKNVYKAIDKCLGKMLIGLGNIEENIE